MKIVVIGNSGSGKSTYAKKLGLPYLELDSIVWEPHGVAIERPFEAARADLHAFLRTHETWVIEGCDGHLAAEALPSCSELIFMNPDVAVCLENNRHRPWEPHKFDSAADQEKMLPYLLEWVQSYYAREGPRSYGYHRKLFDHFAGSKRELLTNG